MKALVVVNSGHKYLLQKPEFCACSCDWRVQTCGKTAIGSAHPFDLYTANDIPHQFS